jgi:hypothetical protein
MPTEIKVTRIKNAAAGSKVKLSLSFAFDADDAGAAAIYRGVALIMQ